MHQTVYKLRSASLIQRGDGKVVKLDTNDTATKKTNSKERRSRSLEKVPLVRIVKRRGISAPSKTGSNVQPNPKSKKSGPKTAKTRIHQERRSRSAPATPNTKPREKSASPAKIRSFKISLENLQQAQIHEIQNQVQRQAMIKRIDLHSLNLNQLKRISAIIKNRRVPTFSPVAPNATAHVIGLLEDNINAIKTDLKSWQSSKPKQSIIKALEDKLSLVRAKALAPMPDVSVTITNSKEQQVVAPTPDILIPTSDEDEALAESFTNLEISGFAVAPPTPHLPQQFDGYEDYLSDLISRMTPPSAEGAAAMEVVTPDADDGWMQDYLTEFIGSALAKLDLSVAPVHDREEVKRRLEF